MAVSASAHVTL